MNTPPLESDSDPDSDGPSLSDVLSEFKQQMTQIESVTKNLDTHVIDLYRRAKYETVDWMQEPLKARAHIQKWCSLHGLPQNPTLDVFIDACFDAAVSIDLESRMITFKKDDAAILWNGRRRLSVFDIISAVPTLFE